MKRKAFTLIELMVVVAIIALLISILLPSLGAAKEAGNKIKCLSNLSGVGKSFKIYAAQNNDQYPAISRGYQINGKDKTGIDKSIDTQASLWLMVVSNMASPQTMICPSDRGAVAYNDEKPKRDTKDDVFPVVNDSGKIDTAGTKRCWSYSYQIPSGDMGNPGKDNPNNTKFAIMADRAPFYADLKITTETTALDARAYLNSLPKDGDTNRRENFNSPNHAGTGQNVLFQDGHAGWVADPWCGIQDDNIYTWATGTTTEAERVQGTLSGSASAVADLPFSDDDSVLCNVLEGVPVTDPAK